MKSRELERQVSVEMFKGSSVYFFMTVHVIFTILLFVAMTHMQMQMSNHIAQQELENNELKKILKNYGYMHSRYGDSDKLNNEFEMQQRNIPQYKTSKSKEMNENEEGTEEENDDDKIPIILRNKRNAKPSCCGKGKRGGKGQKGPRGKRGRKGQKGDPGILGAKGDKGDKGSMGLNGGPGIQGQSGSQGSPGNKGKKGNKGDKGELGQKFSQSAHIVGSGVEERPSYRVGRDFLLQSWTIGHQTGQMSYSNGYLTVGQKGYYNVYCQLYSKQTNATSYHFIIYIDDKPVIKAVKPIISTRKNYKNTNYIGGVFYINAGQRISVRTKYKNLFMYSSTESFFGAFMIHS